MSESLVAAATLARSAAQSHRREGGAVARQPHADERLRAALDYATLGLPVLPLHHPVVEPPASPGATPTIGCSCADAGCQLVGDHPIPPPGVVAATTDRERVRWWWRRFPLANVGLATGFLFDVLEVEGVVGDASRWSVVAATLRVGGPLVRTGGDGWHFYLAPLGLGAWSPVGLARVGWRGLGGHVAAPPSRHRSGAVAAWVRGLDAPLALAPAPLRERLGLPRPGRATASSGPDEQDGYVIPPRSAVPRNVPGWR
jgi:hypothetical protein